MKYLLIDYGNSFIKAATYNPISHKLSKIVQLPKNSSAKDLVKLLKVKSVDKIIETSATSEKIIAPFNKQITKLLKAKFKRVKQEHFKKLLDLSNIAPKTKVGSDILLLTYYCGKKYKAGAVFALGTVYVGIVFKKNMINSCLFVPNIVCGVRNIVNVSSIPQKDLSFVFDKAKGLNTMTAFAAGCNYALEGLIGTVVNHYHLDPNKVVITGGDAHRFSCINQKYKRIDNLVLISLAEFVKDNKW